MNSKLFLSDDCVMGLYDELMGPKTVFVLGTSIPKNLQDICLIKHIHRQLLYEIHHKTSALC
jgi:hypothetical protein